MKWLILFLLSTSLFAVENSKTAPQLATEFYTQLLNSSSNKHSDDQCYPIPDRGSCVKEFCSRMPSWGCDDAEEIQNVTRACSGNYGNKCLANACNKLPTFQRDDFNELSEIAGACRNVFGSECFDFIASKVPSYQVDDRQEVVSVLNQCRSVSAEIMECTKYTCGRLASYACDEVVEIGSVMRNCGR